MITNFTNITNPNQTPVDGDSVSYEVDGRSVISNWDMNVLHQLLKITNKQKSISKLEFRRLFPTTTLSSIDNFEYNISLSDAVSAQLRTIKASFDIAENISLSDPDIELALGFYVMIGFMTEAEKITVLTGGLG